MHESVVIRQGFAPLAPISDPPKIARRLAFLSPPDKRVTSYKFRFQECRVASARGSRDITVAFVSAPRKFSPLFPNQPRLIAICIFMRRATRNHHRADRMHRAADASHIVSMYFVDSLFPLHLSISSPTLFNTPLLMILSQIECHNFGAGEN